MVDEIFNKPYESFFKPENPYEAELHGKDSPAKSQSPP